MKRNNTHIFGLIGFLIVIFIWAVLMFWWLYPYKTSIQFQPYKVSEKVIKQGDLLRYEIDYCKYTNVIPRVERQFIDGIIYAVPQGNAQLKRGCGKVMNSIQIPNALPPGNYYVQMSVTFKMNPIRTITKVYVTEKFQVINK